MDKREFKVGDRVWALLFGWGTVKEIDSGILEYYPVCVEFDSVENKAFFTRGGFYRVSDKNPSLFHANQGKIEFDTDEPIELVDGQPIWVRSEECYEWLPRHAKELGKSGGVFCHNNGQTKHSNVAGTATFWQYFRTTDPALDGASQ